MKNKLISSVIALSAVAPSAFAHQYFNCPYVGVEAIQTNQDFKEGFGKKVFKKDPQNYGVLAGFKFMPNFGVELGYEMQPKRSKDVTLVAGDTAPGGQPGTGNSTARYHSSVKGYHPYVGLFGSYQAKWTSMGATVLQAMVGASVSHIKARTIVDNFNGDNDTPIIRNYSKTKVVPMVKLSATQFFNHHVGVRVLANYRNLSAIKVSSQENHSAQIKLKNTFGVGLGLIYAF